jgi:hypothetical protein
MNDLETVHLTILQTAAKKKKWKEVREMGNFQVVEYCERLEVTPKGKYRLMHHGGSLSVVPAKAKRLSPKEAQAWFEKLFPRRSWMRVVEGVNDWIEYEKRKVNP